jgi:hypothetical protein
VLGAQGVQNGVGARPFGGQLVAVLGTHPVEVAGVLGA